MFLRNILKQAWKSFSAKFRPKWKDQRSTYHVRHILALFCNLIALILIKTVWKALELPKLSKKLSLKGSGASERQKMFSETVIHKIFDINSSFNMKYCTIRKVKSLFKTLILAARLGTRLSFYEVYTLSR